MDRAPLEPDDAELVGRVFEAHRAYVEAVAIRYVGFADAPEIVAEVGLRLCQSLNGVRAPGAIRGWILRATVNAARDWQRDRAKTWRTLAAAAIFERPDSAICDPEADLERAERARRLRAAVDRLNPSEKTAIRHTLGLHSVSSDKNGAERAANSRARAKLRALLGL